MNTAPTAKHPTAPPAPVPIPTAPDIRERFRLRLPTVDAFTAELSDLLNITPRAAELVLSRLTSTDKARIFTDPDGVPRVAFAENFQAVSCCPPVHTSTAPGTDRPETPPDEQNTPALRFSPTRPCQTPNNTTSGPC